MQASRLVSILLLLQTRGMLTARDLADELEVSLRTIYRDLDQLAAAGIPLYAERGPAGGYRLVDGYRTRLTGLSADEAQALFLSGLEGPAAQLGLGTVLAAAQLKVMAALPAELRARAARLRERFLLVAPGWFKRDDDSTWLGAIAEAVWDEKLLRMTYHGPNGPAERLIEPLGLVLKAGVWYVVARRDGLLRTYRVSRILAASCTEDRFERPPDFELQRHWQAASEAFEEGLRRIEIRVRVRSDSVDDLEYAIGGSAWVGGYDREDAGDPGEATRADREASATIPPYPGDPNAWLRATLRTESLGQAHDDLLRLGGRVEVLDPPELRARMARTARAMARRYAGAIKAARTAVGS
jgi:predicted DNA-binding transcriptional regulator YafY